MKRKAVKRKRWIRASVRPAIKRRRNGARLFVIFSTDFAICEGPDACCKCGQYTTADFEKYCNCNKKDYCNCYQNTKKNCVFENSSNNNCNNTYKKNNKKRNREHTIDYGYTNHV